MKFEVWWVCLPGLPRAEIAAPALRGNQTNMLVQSLSFAIPSEQLSKFCIKTPIALIQTCGLAHVIRFRLSPLVGPPSPTKLGAPVNLHSTPRIRHPSTRQSSRTQPCPLARPSFSRDHNPNLNPQFRACPQQQPNSHRRHPIRSLDKALTFPHLLRALPPQNKHQLGSPNRLLPAISGRLCSCAQTTEPPPLPPK